jgi:hypothetical protein
MSTLLTLHHLSIDPTLDTDHQELVRSLMTLQTGRSVTNHYSSLSYACRKNVDHCRGSEAHVRTQGLPVHDARTQCIRRSGNRRTSLCGMPWPCTISKSLLHALMLLILQVVRNEIKEFAATRQLFNDGIKLIILDEADVSVEPGMVVRYSTRRWINISHESSNCLYAAGHDERRSVCAPTNH